MLLEENKNNYVIWSLDKLDPIVLENGGLDLKLIRKKWSEHLNQKANWQHAILGGLMFQAWRERWLESSYF